jgi:hypothetical protein
MWARAIQGSSSRSPAIAGPPDFEMIEPLTGARRALPPSPIPVSPLSRRLRRDLAATQAGVRVEPCRIDGVGQNQRRRPRLVGCLPSQTVLCFCARLRRRGR